MNRATKSSDPRLKENFLRFPLASLAYSRDPIETLDGIAAWCSVDVGVRSSTDYQDYQLVEWIEATVPKALRTMLPRGRKELCAVRGAIILKLYGNDTRASNVLAAHDRMADFLATAGGPSVANTVNMVRRHFIGCYATVANEPVPRSLAWREFRVLCAILSKVGDKRMAECGWQEIQARAAGWSGKLDMSRASEEERSNRGHLMLTRDQIRTVLDRLEKHRFFAKYVHARSKTWFSFSCRGHRERLKEWVHRRKEKKSQIAQNREEDARPLPIDGRRTRVNWKDSGLVPIRIDPEQTKNFDSSLASVEDGYVIENRFNNQKEVTDLVKRDREQFDRIRKAAIPARRYGRNVFERQE